MIHLLDLIPIDHVPGKRNDCGICDTGIRHGSHALLARVKIEQSLYGIHLCEACGKKPGDLLLLDIVRHQLRIAITREQEHARGARNGYTTKKHPSAVQEHLLKIAEQLRQQYVGPSCSPPGSAQINGAEGKIFATILNTFTEDHHE